MNQTRETTPSNHPDSGHQLRALLDEVRVKLHLGGMEAKDAFHEMEKKAEVLGRDVSQGSREAFAEISESLKKLSRTLGGGK